MTSDLEMDARPEPPEPIGAPAIRRGIAAVLAGLHLQNDAAGPAPEAADQDEEQGFASGGFTRKPWAEMSEIEKLSFLDMTDEGLAKRLAYYSKETCLYCPDLGWLVWDGQRYQGCDDKDTYARREVMGMGPRIKKEEYPAFKNLLPDNAAIFKAGGGDTEEGIALKAQRKNGLKSLGRIWSRAVALGNNSLQISVLKVAAALPEFYADFNDLDDRAGLFNTPAGGLDLPLTLPPRSSVGGDASTARYEAEADAMAAQMALSPVPLSKMSPRPKVTRCAKASFDVESFRADADAAPLWQAHLKTLFPDPKMRSYFLRICGSMLVNFNPKRNWVIWRGRGNDGKSTTLRILGEVLGDYWTIGTVETLMSNPHSGASGPRNDLMALAGGTRLVSFVEPDEKKELDAGLIKLLTGGDGVSARGNHQAQKTWMPHFKILLLCNDLPKVKDSTDGFWQRIEIVPFTHQFTKATEDPTLEGRIKAERDGILSTFIEGFYDWRSRGFNYDPPEEAEVMKLRFQDESSQYLAWMRDRILWGGWYNRTSLRDENPDASAELENGNVEAIQVAREHHWCEDEAVYRAPRYNPKEIYKDYLAYCDGEGLSPWKLGGFLKKFKTDAQDKNCTWNKTGADGRHWKGFDFKDGHAHIPSATKDDDDDWALKTGAI